ncbi:DMT family protein [Mesoterricola sediminis]|uniref:Membrane protein n=1 Tax=Mesoterricola sediminis TaxID=2927980 RepID=A0AA48GRQ6_9BACT|nr:DMT family protein [Mesoterricola sediminis]BDU78041.1 membrane protein [Mesoterricola sediminis]
MQVRTWLPITLLVFSNVFMTFAWYGHLRTQKDTPLLWAILSSWGIAFFEYMLMVPANRIGFGRYTLPQLKVIQEGVTLAVFAVFAVVYMRQRLTLNHAWAGLCLMGAVWFTFRK